MTRATRRSSLPGTAELFRSTAEPAASEQATSAEAQEPGAQESDHEPMLPLDGVEELLAERRQARAHLEPAPDLPADLRAELTSPSPAPAASPPVPAVPLPGGHQGVEQSATSPGPARGKPRQAGRRPSGRERHEEKITVYVSADELLDLEHARLTLRGEHGLAVDRGRIVREALAYVLADLDAHGDDSILVRRLREV